MVVALMSQAAAYIGARALPDLLFNSEYTSKLSTLGVGFMLRNSTCICHLYKASCHAHTILLEGRTVESLTMI